jgi:hypothetical protein
VGRIGLFERSGAGNHRACSRSEALSIGAEEYQAQGGDSWCISGGVEHGADILEDSVAIEVFSPVREDYLPGRV